MTNVYAVFFDLPVPGSQHLLAGAGHEIEGLRKGRKSGVAMTCLPFWYLKIVSEA